MKCVICKEGETQNGVTSVTLERKEMLLVIKQVPAQVCSTCGESYVEEKTTEYLLTIGQRAFEEGIQLEVCRYKAA